MDAGFKAFSTDRGYGPEADQLCPGPNIVGVATSSAIVDIAGCEQKPKLGDRIEFIPPHCDPTVNLYDRIYACREESRGSGLAGDGADSTAAQ